MNQEKLIEVTDKRKEVATWLKNHTKSEGESLEMAKYGGGEVRIGARQSSKEFLEFLVSNWAWFELVKEHPLLAPIMEEVFPMLSHVELVERDGQGISKGVKAKTAIGVIMAAWNILDAKDIKEEDAALFFPPEIGGRIVDRRAEWLKLGEGKVSAGFLEWLKTDKFGGSAAKQLDAARNILNLGEGFSVDLLRKIKDKGEMEVFLEICSYLGPEAGLAVARNPGFVLKHVVQQTVRRTGAPPETLRDVTSLVEAKVRENGLIVLGLAKAGEGPVREIPGPYNERDIEKISVRGVLRDELGQIRDAWRADPAAFTAAESFSRWIELTDEFHRRLRAQDREQALRWAWSKFSQFPQYPVEGYRARDLLIIPLRDNISLSLEGVLRKHCVGSYAHSCEAGEVSIYNVRSGTGEIIGTMEVKNSTGAVRQFRGLMNRQISPAMVSRVREIVYALHQEARLSVEVLKKFEQVVVKCTESDGGANLDPVTLLFGAIESGLRGGQKIMDIDNFLVKHADPDELVVLRKSLGARASEFITTEQEANELGQWRQDRAKDKDSVLAGARVDPVRLLIKRLEDQISQGKPIMGVLEDLKKSIGEEWDEYAGHLYWAAKKAAKDPGQMASIQQVETEVPGINKHTDEKSVRRTRWQGLTLPLSRKGSEKISPALVMAYIEEALPKAREAQIGKMAPGPTKKRVA